MQDAERRLAQLVTDGVAAAREGSAAPQGGSKEVASEFDDILQFGDGATLSLLVHTGGGWAWHREMQRVGKKARAARLKEEQAAQEAQGQVAGSGAAAHNNRAQAAAKSEPAQMAAVGRQQSAKRLSMRQSVTSRALAI